MVHGPMVGPCTWLDEVQIQWGVRHWPNDPDCRMTKTKQPRCPNDPKYCIWDLHNVMLQRRNHFSTVFNKSQQLKKHLCSIFVSPEGNFDWRRGWGWGGGIFFSFFKTKTRRISTNQHIALNVFYTILFILYIYILHIYIRYSIAARKYQ